MEEKTTLVRALYDFTPSDEDSKITIHEGDIIAVIDSSHDDWWLGYVVQDGTSSGSGPQGYFPRNFVEETNDDRQSEVGETASDREPDHDEISSERQDDDTLGAEESISPVEAWFPEYCLYVESSKLLQLPSKNTSSKHKNVLVPVYRISVLERAVKTDERVRYAGSIIHCTLEDVLKFDALLCDKFPNTFGDPAFTDKESLEDLVARAPISSAVLPRKLQAMDVTTILSNPSHQDLFPFCKDIYRFTNPPHPVTHDMYFSLPVSLQDLRTELRALASQSTAPASTPCSAELERIRNILQAYFAHLLVAAHSAQLPSSLFYPATSPSATRSPPVSHKAYADIPSHTAADIWVCFRNFFMCGPEGDGATATSTPLVPVIHSDLFFCYIGKGVQYSATVHPPLSRMSQDIDHAFSVTEHPLEPVAVGLTLSARAALETEARFWEEFWEQHEEEEKHREEERLRNERKVLEEQLRRERVNTTDSETTASSFQRTPHLVPQTPLPTPALRSQPGQVSPPMLPTVTPTVSATGDQAEEEDEIAAFERMMGLEAPEESKSSPSEATPATGLVEAESADDRTLSQYPEVDAYLNTVPKLHIQYEEKERFTPGDHYMFGLEDMDAFDGLLESQWAVVFDEDGISLRPVTTGDDVSPTTSSWHSLVPGTDDDSSPSTRSNMLIINPLSTLEISFFSLLWDGAASNATGVEKAVSCTFTLGDFRNTDTLPLGVHQALYSLVQQGQSLRSHTPFALILAPSLAYGDNGRPTSPDTESLRHSIPPNVHMVYLLSIRSSAPSPKANLIPDFGAYCRHLGGDNEVRLGLQPSATKKKKKEPAPTPKPTLASTNKPANAVKRASSMPYLPPPAPHNTPEYGALPTPGTSRSSRNFRSSTSVSALYGPLPPGGAPGSPDPTRDRIDTLNPALVKGAGLSSDQKNKLDPEHAERAFREYLSTLQQPPGGEDPKNKKKSIRRLIKSAFTKKNKD